MLPAMMLVLSFSLSGTKFDNLARIAYFTMAYQMIDRILPVTRSVSFALLPKITTASDKDASDLAAKASRQTLLVSIVLFFILAMLMQPIVSILLGERFIPVVWAFVFLAPAGVALSVGGVWSNHLLARTRPYEVARAGIIGVVVALIVSGIGFQFTSSREVLVAAGAVLIGSFVNAGFLLSSFCRVGKISLYGALIPTMSDFREWRRIPGLIRSMINRSASKI
jgi:O-antigen/teichoic acid export membrane protein